MRALLAGLFLLCAATPAFAQAQIESPYAGAWAELGQGAHRALVRSSRAELLSRTWRMIGFHRIDGAWIARRIEGDETQRTQESHAKAADCPQIEARLHALETLAPPQIMLPGIGPTERPPIPVLDGVAYRLQSGWVIFGETDIGGIELSSNVGTPLAVWTDETFAALEPCWTQAETAR